MDRTGPVFGPVRASAHRPQPGPQTTDHRPSVVTGEYDEQAVVIASGQRIRCCLKNPQDFIPAPLKVQRRPLREKGEGPEGFLRKNRIKKEKVRGVGVIINKYR